MLHKLPQIFRKQLKRYKGHQKKGTSTLGRVEATEFQVTDFRR
jgi:hypothetical protein